MTSKNDILRSLHQALQTSGYAQEAAIDRHSDLPKNYLSEGENPPGSPEVIAELVDRLEDYNAQATVAQTDDEVAEAIAGFLADTPSVVVPPGLPPQWLSKVSESTAVLEDSPRDPRSKDELDACGAVITASRCAISQTGTIILDGEPDQGRRIISLLPDLHVLVVRAETIVPTVPQAFSILAEHPNRPLTWIAGPSATSDIELIRVDGVHGPRNLRVIIFAPHLPRTGS